MYVDLVIVKHNGSDTIPYIFEAPAFSHLGAGTLVEVDTYKGRTQGMVLGSCTTSLDSDEYKCFALMAKGKPFKKVRTVYKAKECIYKEEEECCAVTTATD